MPKPTYQLTDVEGELCLSDDDKTPVTHYNGHGDVSTIARPDYDFHKLRNMLYDLRETGEIPDVDTVLLPDGTSFDIEP